MRPRMTAPVNGVLDPEELEPLLDVSPPSLRKVIIAAHEACLSRSDLLTLVRDELHRKSPATAIIKIAAGRNKTKAKQKVPISPALAEVWTNRPRPKKVTSLHGTPWSLATVNPSPGTLRKAFNCQATSVEALTRQTSTPSDAKMIRVFAEKLGWKNVNEVSTQELRQTAASAN